MMGYLSKFGYDEVYFNKILLQNIENDALLKQDDALKKALCELVSQGGKRIRPLFLLMATDLGSYPKKEDCYLAAVAIELLHLSSLIHDDIIDHSPMRHNVLTLHERYGAKIALKLGNYTLNKSLELFSHFDDPRLHLQLAHTMKQLCLGELKQKEDLFNFNLQLEDYIEKSHQKTGTLISVSLVIGGLIAHLSNDELVILAMEKFDNQNFRFFYKGIPLKEYCKEHQEVNYNTIRSYINTEKRKHPELSDEELIEQYLDKEHKGCYRYYYLGIPLKE